MAALARSAATLRIGGDNLRPSEISKLLSATPTLARAKGELMKPGGKAVARAGLWHLSAKATAPADIDRQVTEILAQLPPDLETWHSLTARYRVDLFCGWFMDQGDEGLEIAPRTLSALGDRGIKLGVCLYPPLSSGATLRSPCDSDEAETGDLNFAPGDIYEDAFGHPCLCVGVSVDEDEIWGISLIDGSQPRSSSLAHTVTRKFSASEAWTVKQRLRHS